MQLTQELKEHLQSEGYVLLVETKDFGICGLQRFMFTIGLVVGIDRYGYARRYCYPNLEQAVKGMSAWLKDGVEDPQDSMWIKRKGDKGDYCNPLLLGKTSKNIA